MLGSTHGSGNRGPRGGYPRAACQAAFRFAPRSAICGKKRDYAARRLGNVS